MRFLISPCLPCGVDGMRSLMFPEPLREMGVDGTGPGNLGTVGSSLGSCVDIGDAMGSSPTTVEHGAGIQAGSLLDELASWIIDTSPLAAPLRCAFCEGSCEALLLAALERLRSNPVSGSVGNWRAISAALLILTFFDCAAASLTSLSVYENVCRSCSNLFLSCLREWNIFVAILSPLFLGWRSFSIPF